MAPSGSIDVVTRTRVALLSAALTAVTVVGLITVVGLGLKWFGDGLGREELFESCEVDPTLSGKQGYCVVVSRYPATPVHSQRTRLEVAAVYDGARSDYRFVVGYPFSESSAGEDLQVDWSQVEERIAVTDERTGSTATYTIEQYGGGR